MAGSNAALEALRAGRAVVFPTDTVLGLGVAVRYAPDCGELYRIKQRPVGKPVAWLVASADDLRIYGRNVPAWALELARAHWPGALTLVVRASDAVPTGFRSAEGTIGLRMPASRAALELIEEIGCPLATTSANRSGQPAPRTLDELDPAIAAHVEAVVANEEPGDGGSATGNDSSSGVASTVVDCTGSEPRILRQGDVAINAISSPC